MPISRDELESPVKPTWCPGCGDFGIWLSLKMALSQLDCDLKDVVIVYGIGCSGHMCSFIKGFGFEGLHGRPIPLAEGVKLANPRLKVIVVSGDGDTYGEGLNHFITAVRANHDVTLIVHDNRVYGLTTGQASPTASKGYKAKSTPAGVIEVPVNPLALAISASGTFVARGFCADQQHLVDLMKQGIAHKGFALIDVMQNCATFNKVNTVLWFKQHTYRLEEHGHDPNDRMAALARAFDEEKLGVGVFYRSAREAYTDDLPQDKVPIIDHDLSKIDLSSTCETFY